MIDRALFVRIEAKEGKEDEVEDFLKSALDDVMEEDGTVDWYAVNMPSCWRSRTRWRKRYGLKQPATATNGFRLTNACRPARSDPVPFSHLVAQLPSAELARSRMSGYPGSGHLF